MLLSLPLLQLFLLCSVRDVGTPVITFMNTLCSICFLECLKYCKGLIPVRHLSFEERKWCWDSRPGDQFAVQARQAMPSYFSSLCFGSGVLRRITCWKTKLWNRRKKSSLSWKAETSQISVWGLRYDTYCDPYVHLCLLLHQKPPEM